jgi:hypothetical protein
MPPDRIAPTMARALGMIVLLGLAAALGAPARAVDRW